MNIVLFTTALPESIYQDAVSKNHPINPSGQNFYWRLGQAIDTFAHRRTIAFAPSGTQAKRDGDLFLVKREAHRKFTIKNIVAAFAKAIADFKPDFLICTSLNLTLSKAAKILSKRHAIPLISVLTDDPRNITNARFGFRSLSLRYAKDAGAFLSLTPKLNEIYNPSKKPCFIFPGIVDPSTQPHLPKVSGDYYYYGGALYEKDGVGSLIRAYLRSGSTIPLYLAGHGEMEKQISEWCAANPNLHFLGQISREENATMEEHALALINPRWYNKKLDAVSVPSKMLEYLSLGHRVVSTTSSSIRPMFESSVCWLPNKPKEIENRLVELFQTNFADAPLCRCREELQSYFGYEELGKRLNAFLLGL